MAKLLKNPHPGKILQEEFLEPLGLSQNALAQAIGIKRVALGRGIQEEKTYESASE